MIVVEKLDYQLEFEVDLVVDNGLALERWRNVAHDEWNRMFLDEWARPRMRVDCKGVLIQLLRIADDRDDLWLGFEWVPRVALHELLRAEGAHEGIALPLVCGMLADVARALESMHAFHEMAHRDVSTRTVAFGIDGRTRLDWRPRRPIERSSMTRTSGVIKGVLGSLSPEQVRGEIVHPATDLWSLGVVAFHALAGRSPFRRDNDIDTLHAIFNDDRPRLLNLRADVPEPLANLVERMLTRDQTARPAPREVIEVIERDLAWATWDLAMRAKEQRALVPREMEAVLKLDDRARAAMSRELPAERAPSRS